MADDVLAIHPAAETDIEEAFAYIELSLPPLTQASRNGAMVLYEAVPLEP